MAKQYCTIRKDLESQHLSVTIGDDTVQSFVTGNEELEYRWIDDDTFQVKYKGKWVNANSIDFEFTREFDPNDVPTDKLIELFRDDTQPEDVRDKAYREAEKRRVSTIHKRHSLDDEPET